MKSIVMPYNVTTNAATICPVSLMYGFKSYMSSISPTRYIMMAPKIRGFTSLSIGWPNQIPIKKRII